jgi:hypothetical protein
MIHTGENIIINFCKARNLKQLFVTPAELQVGQLLTGIFKGIITRIMKTKQGKEYQANVLLLYSPEDKKIYSIYSTYALDDYMQLVTHNQFIGIYRAKNDEKDYKVLKLYLPGTKDENQNPDSVILEADSLDNLNF